MQVLQVMPFRITRNADSDSDQEDTEDLLQMIEEELRQRRFAEVVRMEIGAQSDEWMLEFLRQELNLTREDIYEIPAEFELMDLGGIVDLPKAHLKYEPYNAVIPQALLDENQNIFDVIKNGDLLVHHPYESFVQTVERFIRTASEDPKVLAIKMTLYRTGDNSAFIQSLIRAAEVGKQVVCLVELKARFDEERNIFWAQALENAGVHVVYGIVGLKTHAKTALVVRQESDGLRCYSHIGTGNYNSATARFYTDVGLLTAREEITRELVSFFNYLTGRSLRTEYKYLLVAPVNMFARFKKMIEREADNAEKGLPAQIIAKFNNMEENDLAAALYAASQRKVEIDLIVRGFCCVKPGLVGLSEKIRVKSVIGRFLEHSRIFYFRNGAVDPIDGDFYIGSADWMYRNLHSRVEAIVPILERSLKEKCWEILQTYLKDQRQSWAMRTDGTYEQGQSKDASAQDVLMALTRQKAIQSDEAGS
jgi:polyphosphate kinase